MPHELKTHPKPFQAVWDGIKNYEIRVPDRPFKEWDVVILKEYNPKNNTYSGREIHANITYMTSPENYGLPSNLCVFSIKVYARIDKRLKRV